MSDRENATEDSLLAKVIATFGVVLVTALLLRPMQRLGAAAWEPIARDMLTAPMWAIYVAWVVFQAYTEGYRGFQLRFCPRVIARAVHLGRNPRPLHVVLALPFVLSLFHAPPKRLLARYIFLAALILLIVLVRRLPQPWLGIIDGGVVVGLGWGVVALWWMLLRYLMGRGAPEPTDLPEPPNADSDADSTARTATA